MKSGVAEDGSTPMLHLAAVNVRCSRQFNLNA